MLKTLIITIDFQPQKGGVANYMENVCLNLPSEAIVVLADKEDKDYDYAKLDKTKPYKIIRRTLITKYPIWPRWVLTLWHTYGLIKKYNIKQIHAAQVLPIGTVALIFKILMGLDYIVYTHGMDILVPQKSRRKKWLLKKILASKL